VLSEIPYIKREIDMDKSKNNYHSIPIISTLLILIILTLTITTVSAEDKLKPILEEAYNSIKKFIDRIADIIFDIFPGLRDSLYGLFFWEPEEEYLSWVRSLRSFFWLFYIAAFIVIIAFLMQLWSTSKRYLYNTITGLLILLICIHMLGVGLKFTVFNLILVVLLGIPGAIMVLIFYYLGLPI